MPVNQGHVQSAKQAVDTIDWTIRCDWLQVASFCIIVQILLKHDGTCNKQLDVAHTLAGYIVIHKVPH